jgi:tetratricopeptide (TPR) repeat protein
MINIVKKITLSTICVIFFSSVSSQDLVKRISLQICNCIDTIENRDSLQVKLDRCASESISLVWDSDAEDDQDYSVSDDSITTTMDSVMDKLTYYCPKIKEFILADKESQYYKMSDSEIANKFYLAGNEALKTNDFKTAEKQYLKAIKADPKWVYPYDNLALTFRKLDQYKKAIKYYSKSLEIYPEGSFALQNQAVSYTYLKDYKNALKNYDRLINLYPNNPEGFFGTAKLLFLNEDYENALDYAFYTHEMYLSQESDYAKDTEKLISLIHDKMKEQNKLDIFNEKAKKHGITINQK